MATRKLAPDLESRLRSAPNTTVHLIVGVKGDLEARATQLAARGLAVHRKLALIGALAVEATGSQALALSTEPWIAWMELDREVRALTPKDDRRH